ncbi:glycosyltransferase family 2 protein [Weissella confusa]|nr:glycosyltransferase [Weissella confusa]
MKNKPLVSIIIPAYNIEKWITKSVTSAMNQSYLNVEIIVVDDDSTDATKDMVLQLTEKDGRVRLFTKSNGGLSSSRNFGMQQASGKYILFLDGDDWLDNDVVETTVSIAEKHQTPLVFFPYFREFKDKSVMTPLFTETELFFEGDNWSNVYLSMLGPTASKSNPVSIDRLSTAWGKLYLREAVRFEFLDYQYNYPEDLLFNIKNLSMISTAAYTESAAYHYNKMNESSVTKEFSFSRFEGSNKLIDQLNEFVSTYPNRYKYAVNNRSLVRLLAFLMISVQSSGTYKEQLSRIRRLFLSAENHLTKDNQLVKFISGMSFPWRILFLSIINKRVRFVYWFIRLIVIAKTILK